MPPLGRSTTIAFRGIFSEPWWEIKWNKASQLPIWKQLARPESKLYKALKFMSATKHCHPHMMWMWQPRTCSSYGGLFKTFAGLGPSPVHETPPFLSSHQRQLVVTERSSVISSVVWPPVNCPSVQHLPKLRSNIYWTEEQVRVRTSLQEEGVQGEGTREGNGGMNIFIMHCVCVWNCQ